MKQRLEFSDGTSAAKLQAATPAATTASDDLVPAGLRELFGASCFVKDEDGDEDDILLFDWWALPKQFRDQMVADLFGDCSVPGDFPALLGDPLTWVSRTCIPFALAGVASGGDVLGPDGGVPQFARLLLIDATGAIHAIDVDGTAVPAEAPEKIAKSWDKLKIKKRPPVKPVVAGQLPKVKTTRHARLVGAPGTFVPPSRESAMVREIQVSADGKLAVLAMRADRDECGALVVEVATGARVAHFGSEHGLAASPPPCRIVPVAGRKSRTNWGAKMHDESTGNVVMAKHGVVGTLRRSARRPLRRWPSTARARSRVRGRGCGCETPRLRRTPTPEA